MTDLELQAWALWSTQRSRLRRKAKHEARRDTLLFGGLGVLTFACWVVGLR